jgi:hypothetical protein
MTQFLFTSNPWLLLLATIVILGLMVEVPYRLSKAVPGVPTGTSDAWNAAQAGLLTLSAFIIAFSFNQAAARFEVRRTLVNDETNAIGTTWLRANQLPTPQSTQFRQLLADYTASRLKVYETPGDLDDDHAIERSNRDENALWSIASAAPLTARPQLMTAVNDMIDVSATQLNAMRSHVPVVMFLLTFALVALGTATIGIRCALDRSRPLLLTSIYVVAYAVIISMAIDYDRPQTGVMNVDFTPLSQELETMQGRTPY